MQVTDANREEVYRVPLFIKAPGQTHGEIRDDSAQNLDVLPSIVDLLDADVDWEFDGHSLFDGSAAHTRRRCRPTSTAAIAIAARRAEEFPHGDDWTALAAVGEHGDLVGREVADLEVGAPSEWRATLDQADAVRRPADRRRSSCRSCSPARVTARTGEPPELLAAVNGTLAGVVGGYRPSDGGWDVHRLRRRPLRRRAQRGRRCTRSTGDGGDVTLRPAPADAVRSGRSGTACGCRWSRWPRPRSGAASACSQCSRS